jgi:hypothetical protein
MNELNWSWIALALTAPPLVGGLIAFPIWQKGQPILGNLAGTIVIFGAAVALILRERVELDRVSQACLGRGLVCWPDPSAATSRRAVRVCRHRENEVALRRRVIRLIDSGILAAPCPGRSR